MKEKIKKIYLLLALCYSIAVPIIAALNCKFKFLPLFSVFINTIVVISILVYITFIIDCIINKIKITNVIKFIKNNKSIIFLMLGFIFLTISCFNAENVNLAIWGYSYRFGGLMSYVFYIALAILGYKLDLKYRNIFFNSLIIIATLTCFICLININYLNGFLFNKYCAMYFNENHFANYLLYVIVILMFCFYNSKKISLDIVYGGCFAIIISELIINNTFGCYLAVIFIFIISIMFIIKNKLYLKYGILLIIFIFLSLFVNDYGKYNVKNNFNELLHDLNVIKEYYEIDEVEEKNKEFNDEVKYVGSLRGELWYYTKELIKERPLIGFGLENLTEEYEIFELEQEGMDMPHNLILYLWVYGGIFTLISYVINYIILFIKNRKKLFVEDNNSVIVFIILAHLFSSMFNNTLFYITSLYAILFGMIYNHKKENKN